ncbi:uncharacterized protein PHACADRAFT_204947 [Phanerochaete carnosa HHB-10118-sp]|uniref:Homeobox domain-containing protein n=1 Tax=Phanerochaete carnosa (strain HHB-10118-sp) TaxID=650164 RepID=K5WCY8_PHACS|nr:uncharacterized protein PHACADRAFT_204947 [Phanerochaete carnosa HHB-10118-sp]EKM61793.1 hypothetical protein PHACADRAFT_204947 [Phanerochaete carnosa HHB-10118-sp]
MSLLESPRSPSLFRTSSATSVGSVDTQSSLDDTAIDGELPRRTRKRFTSTQLMMLEHLYHQTSHPTREQREAVAKEASIELRSVTVWFQNKRQTERKVALHNNPAGTDDPTLSAMLFPTIADARGRRISHHASRSPPLSAVSASSSSSVRTVRNHMYHHHSHPHQQRRPTVSLGALKRPSLDAIATRAERPEPRTPPRARTYSIPEDPRSLYEHMPSSPPSPLSPAVERDRDLLDFGLRRRPRAKPTLEWACAAARLSGNKSAREEDRDGDVDMMVLDITGGDTEDEMDLPHEALTPSSSLSSQATVWRRSGNVRPIVPLDVNATPKPAAKTVSQNDVMEAALALCGLGEAR